jgi:mRNA deadenylase 3'-5' endonuclease subunit Ccr4
MGPNRRRRKDGKVQVQTLPRPAPISYAFFVEGGGLALQATRALPREADVGAEGLPNAHFPSDHIPLAARFVWDE